MEPWSGSMHTRSGLLDAIEASSSPSTTPDARPWTSLKAHVPEKGSVPLCGNSIGTDRRFLAAQLPDIENWLHYRSVDVSTVKELCRRWYPEAWPRRRPRRPTHRALDDVRESVAELAYYRATIFVPGGRPVPPAVGTVGQ